MECDEIEGKQDTYLTDLKLEYTDDTYTVIESTSEPTLLVVDSILNDAHNSDPCESYIFEDAVKSEYDGTECKKVYSSDDIKSEYTQDKYTVTDPTSVPTSLIIDPSWKINTQNISQYNNCIVEELLKSECDEIEHELAYASIDLKSDVYRENKYKAAVVPDSVQIKTESIDSSQSYSVGVIHYENDEFGLKKEISSYGIKSELTHDKYTISETISELTPLDYNSSCQINTQNTAQSEDYIVDAVKTEYFENEREQKYSVKLKSEVCTEDKYDATVPTSDFLSLVPDSVQINTENIDSSQGYSLGVIKYGNYGNELKHEVSSDEVKSEFIQDKHTISEPTSELTSLEYNSSCQINTQNTAQSEDNIVDAVKTEYVETERVQEYSSIKLKSEVCTEDKYDATVATSDSLSLVPDSVQINTVNIDSSQGYSVEVIKYGNGEIELKQEVSSIDFKSENTEDKKIVAEPTKNPISLHNPTPIIYQVNTHNTAQSEDYIAYYHETGRKQENLSIDLNFDIHSEEQAEPLSVDVIASREINSENTNPPEDYNFAKTVRAVQRVKKAFSCDVCTKVYFWRSHLKIHQLTHTGEKLFSCGVCTKAFYRRNDLKRHQLTHTGEKSFSCDVCTKAFYRRSYLKIHQLTHKGEKLFSCYACSKAFSRKCHVQRHLLTHTGEKSFSCDVCIKAFNSGSDLRRHQLTHTREKSFTCDICTKAFSWKSDLQRHLLTHTGEKSFSCDVCIKAFYSESDLRRHQLTHTREKSFTCDICTKVFSWKSDLQRHLLTHTGEKLFSCDVCTKAFSRKNDLRRHLLTHTGEKSFSCDVCIKAFSRKSNLKRHRFTHTGDKIFFV